MSAHNYILHITQIKRCGVHHNFKHYIGQGIYTILKLVVGLEDQRVFILGWISTLSVPARTPPDGCQQIFADQLHRVTAYRPQEATDRRDRPHQARVGAFVFFFNTNNKPYFTHLSNGIVRMRCHVPRPSPSFAQSWERGGWWTQTWSVNNSQFISPHNKA